MNQASLIARAAAMVAAVALLLASPASALAAAAGSPATAGRAAVAGPEAPPRAAEEATPIDLTGASDGGATSGGGGGSLVRTIVGLAIVIGVIYGVAWVLRQVKASRQPRATGAGLAALASVPLANGRSVHLVRAGTDLVLLGVAEQGVVPIRTYTQEEARAAGLVDDDGMLILPAGDEPGGDRVALERKRLALPAALSPKALAAARAAARTPAAAAPRTAAARPKLQLPAPRDAVNTLRAWTVRG